MLRLLKEHIYGGRHFRPKPVIIAQPNHFTLLTPWGHHNESLESELVDSQIQEGESLSEYAARLHQQIHANHEGRVGVEILCMLKGQGPLVQWWACGQPALILTQAAKSVLLHQSLDFNFDSSASPQVQPLPSALLGAEEEMAPHSAGSFRLQPEQKIVLLSRSWLPTNALDDLVDGEKCIRALAADAEDMPFWWGLFEPER